MAQGSFPQAGFFFQNHIAAQKILEMIELGSSVRSITLENYEKGPHIDDIIVEADDGTTFYQIALPLDRSELPPPWSKIDSDTPATKPSAK